MAAQKPRDIPLINLTFESSESDVHKTREKVIGKRVSPPEIVNVDEDDVSPLHATPIVSSNKNSGSSTNNAISVEQYSEDRDLRRAIMASLSTKTSNKRGKRIIDLSRDYPDDDSDDDVQFLPTFTSPSSRINNSRKKMKPFFGDGASINEPGESSNSNPATFVCEICVEPKGIGDYFHIMGCTHFYCSDCMIRYVASKLQENITQIRCPDPGCKGLLEPEHCRSILPQEVFDRWGNALCEAVILGSEKFYCPYKDCSALLIDDGGEGVITQSECPNCRRLFCVQCKVPWHSGIECGEFQKLNKDEREREDIMLMQLAKRKMWSRCPKCGFYVEKIYGCNIVRCRCGHSFYYDSGVPLTGHLFGNPINFRSTISRVPSAPRTGSFVRQATNLPNLSKRVSQLQSLLRSRSTILGAPSAPQTGSFVRQAASPSNRSGQLSQFASLLQTRHNPSYFNML